MRTVPLSVSPRLQFSLFKNTKGIWNVSEPSNISVNFVTHTKRADYDLKHTPPHLSDMVVVLLWVFAMGTGILAFIYDFTEEKDCRNTVCSGLTKHMKTHQILHHETEKQFLTYRMQPKSFSGWRDELAGSNTWTVLRTWKKADYNSRKWLTKVCGSITGKI